MVIAAVPAYNEEQSIRSVVKQLSEVVDKVVVVDDGSLDETADQARLKNTTVITHPINRGQGAALETARKYILHQTKAGFVVTFDGDHQFQTEEIEPALEKMKQKQVDVLLGSRFLNKESKLPWSKQNIILPASRIVEYIFTGVYLSDVHNGFKIFSRKALEQISISQDRMAHASEIPQLIKEHDLDYIEFPVKVDYQEYGQDAAAGLGILKDLILGKFIK